MAFPSISVSNAYARSAGVKAIYTRPSGGLWQTLGGIKNGVASLPPIRDVDGNRRNKGKGNLVAASALMRQAGAVEIHLMYALCDGTNDFLFQMQDAAAIPATTPAATEGWFMFSAAQIGVIADVDLSGNYDAKRTIKLDFAGSIKSTEWDAAVKAVIADVQFESTTDTGTFHAIGQYSAAKNGGLPDESHVVNNGIDSITFADVAGGSAVTLGAIKDYVGHIKFKSDASDMRRRHTAFAIDIDMAYGWKQTDAASLLVVDAMVGLAVNMVTNFTSGLVVTLNDIVGITPEYDNNGDMDKTRAVKMDHSGTWPTSIYDGIFSGT